MIMVLPTERMIEKEKNVRAKDMSREEFIKLCLEFLKQELPRIYSGLEKYRDKL